MTSSSFFRFRSTTAELPSLDPDEISSAQKDLRLSPETTRTNQLKLLPQPTSLRRRLLLATSLSQQSSTPKLPHLRPTYRLRVKPNPTRKMRKISLARELSKETDRTRNLRVQNPRRLANSLKTKVGQSDESLELYGSFT